MNQYYKPTSAADEKRKKDKAKIKKGSKNTVYASASSKQLDSALD